ncbi:CpaD family pilus assembly protein [Lutibaculum baratangense]|uniref:Components of type IV pilus n=1 Tax=Lutibaculum baratangense AMV1 TaxID=631454 RepID=V4QYJ2_9HYPH|nr:CpaD family pilus assembly protein [Lutibaculum baratangense]ESR24822.1 components of type IV pilus [Lutibaculum baratangense AMV1]
MMRTSHLSLRRPAPKVLAALLAILPVAACQNGQMTTASMPIAVEDRHPIGVVPERVVLDVNGGGAAELQSFVLAYGQEGHGPLYVLAPNGGDRRMSEAVYADARRAANAAGIPVASISYAGYEPVTRGAPVKLVYERMVAATTCGQWPDNAAQGARNEPYYNFGCATQKNFAAMLEDPRDLEGPRYQTPRDATRRDVVFDKYRQGERTGAEAETGGDGRASEVGE